MPEQQKTFKVICAHCAQPFHVRFALIKSDAEGTGEVVVECLYCSKRVKVEVPREYIPDEHMLRGLKSIPASE